MEFYSGICKDKIQKNHSSPGRCATGGFFAGGEIARPHLYGYTGVLTVFTSE